MIDRIANTPIATTLIASTGIGTWMLGQTPNSGVSSWVSAGSVVGLCGAMLYIFAQIQATQAEDRKAERQEDREERHRHHEYLIRVINESREDRKATDAIQRELVTVVREVVGEVHQSSEAMQSTHITMQETYKAVENLNKNLELRPCQMHKQQIKELLVEIKNENN